MKIDMYDGWYTTAAGNDFEKRFKIVWKNAL